MSPFKKGLVKSPPTSNPDITKNKSTPKDPYGNVSLKWYRTTEIMAIPLQMSTLETLLLEHKTLLRLSNIINTNSSLNKGLLKDCVYCIKNLTKCNLKSD